MEKIRVEIKNKEIVTEIVYNIKDFPYREIEKFSRDKIVNKQKKGKRKKLEYYNIPCAFDIETTNIWSEEKPFAFMYQWQFCFNDTVVFGRTWNEFLEFLKKLSYFLHLDKNKRLVIYVHNLAFEFQFMKDFLQIDSLFAKSKRKPMKFLSGGLEFRCSYFLSNMTLQKFCENSPSCIHYKLTDTFDYRKIRTTKTILTEEEKAYCYNDVRGLCECIKDKMEVDNLAEIPLTSTGYVRREYRRAMQSNPNNYYLLQSTALNPIQYSKLREAFRGGNTHANYKKANKIIDEVYSFDISSSYPSCINFDDFPLGKFYTLTNLRRFDLIDEYLETKCCVMTVAFEKICVKKNTYIPYIDISHCINSLHIINDNGRVLQADYIELTITNIDYDIICETYDFEYESIHFFMYADKGKLPNELRKKMLEFYDGKTQLKGVKGKEYEYAKSKNLLNATFGMMVTDLAHEEVLYNSERMEWTNEKPDVKFALQDFYKNKNSFLAYQWGVFVTANARRRLQNMINKVGKDIVYIDTDSIKFVNKNHIKEFNNINKILENQALYNDIRGYSVRDNKKYFLGTWDNDGSYKKFKTLGAKKYCYVDKNNEFHITVSGMSKKLGAKSVGSIDNFNIGETYNNVGRTVAWYNDEKPHIIKINDDEILTASSIGIFESTYTLGVTNEYWSLLEGDTENTIESFL